MTQCCARNSTSADRCKRPTPAVERDFCEFHERRRQSGLPVFCLRCDRLYNGRQIPEPAKSILDECGTEPYPCAGCELDRASKGRMITQFDSPGI